MTYKINGIEFLLQPTKGRWLPRKLLGIDGNGHAIYPSVYEYEIQWNIMSQEDFHQLIEFFDSIGITGSAVVDLPYRRGSSYTFYSYSGCIIREPQIEDYFAEYPTRIRLKITNIKA